MLVIPHAWEHMHGACSTAVTALVEEDVAMAAMQLDSLESVQAAFREVGKGIGPCQLCLFPGQGSTLLAHDMDSALHHGDNGWRTWASFCWARLPGASGGRDALTLVACVLLLTVLDFALVARLCPCLW